MTITKFVLCLVLLPLAGCAATGSPLTSAQPSVDKSRDSCIDIRKETRSWTSVAPNTLLIDQGRFKYEVEVLQCDIAEFDKFAISQGPEKPVVGPDGRFMYASQVFDGRVCGQAGDRLVMRKSTADFFTPGQTCRISAVRRLDK